MWRQAFLLRRIRRSGSSGSNKAVDDTCPRCGKETVDTVGFIHEDSIRTRLTFAAADLNI
jgi:hypothetical protein